MIGRCCSIEKISTVVYYIGNLVGKWELRRGVELKGGIKLGSEGVELSRRSSELMIVEGGG